MRAFAIHATAAGLTALAVVVLFLAYMFAAGLM